jgi:hypothetical protein
MKKLLNRVIGWFRPAERFVSFKMDRKYDRRVGDEISLYVQECGGHFELLRSEVQFHVPEHCREFVLLKYPFLKGGQL